MGGGPISLTSKNPNLGRNDQSGVTNPETREYDEHLVSAGVLCKF